MKYNKWKEANDYWRMVINEPFKVKGRNVMLLNYIANYYTRPNKSNYVTKVMNRFINYLNTICGEIYSCVQELDGDMYGLLYKDIYREGLIGINPYISITNEQVCAISRFREVFLNYKTACYLRKPLVNGLLDAIDAISPIQDVLRQHKYNIAHKRKHPYPIISGNVLEQLGHSNTQYYDDYKKFYLDCLRRNIDVTKTFYKYNTSLDVRHIFNIAFNRA